MKVTKELEYAVTIKAVLDEEGQLRVSLIAVAPYGNRTATATVDDFPEDTLAPIKRALEKVLHSQGQRAVLAAERAASVSHAVAIAKGEEI